MSRIADHLHIITGGPGSGKTSLIDALAAEGVRHMPEAGRTIIQDQVEIGASLCRGMIGKRLQP